MVSERGKEKKLVTASDRGSGNDWHGHFGSRNAFCFGYARPALGSLLPRSLRAAALVSFIFGVVAFHAAVASAVGPLPVVVSLSASKTSYAAGEVPELQIRLTNPNSVPISIADTESTTLTFRVKAGGKAASVSRVILRPTFDIHPKELAQQRVIALAPDQSVQLTKTFESPNELSQVARKGTSEIHYRLAIPGKYFIRVAYQYTGPVPIGSAPTPSKAAVSNEITVVLN